MTFNVTIKEIFPNAIHLFFETQYEITSTMLRVQEFYESPYEDINGKYFLLEDYMDTYAKEMGNFTYTTDWSGFNVPGNIFNKFFKVFNGNLLEKEIHLKRMIDEKKKELNIKDDEDNFYVIASYNDDRNSGKEVLKHEMAHAMYYLDELYKRKMDDIIRGMFVADRDQLIDAIVNKGYNENVALDEIQAYSSTSDMLELVDTFQSEKLPWATILRCKQTFEEYYEDIDSLAIAFP